MEVSCPACAARYTADDEKLRGKTARMRCRACDTVWLVSGPSAADRGARDRERRAAVARRGVERERRDLFASRPPEHGFGSVRETLRPAPTGVAARNENSVLFKVDDIFGTARSDAHSARPSTMRPPAMPALPTGMAGGAGAPGGAGQRNDDSGIIDLKALAAAAAAPRAARAPVANLFGASESPPAAFARELSAASASYPAQGPGTPLFGGPRRYAGMAAAFAVFALCAVGVAVTFGGGDPPPKAAAVIELPAPPPAPAAVTQPAPEPTEAAASSAEDSHAASLATKSPAKKTTRKGAKARKSTTKSSAASAPPPVKKVKPSDPCHCRGDFNCVIACAAGR